MMELSRRLSDIEFIEGQNALAAPVVSPSAFSRHPARRRGSVVIDGVPRGASPPAYSALPPPPAYSASPLMGRPTSPLANEVMSDDGHLRSRMRVRPSEPSRLGGLDLVEPAKVDGQYEEDGETREYRLRRRRRESVGPEGISQQQQQRRGRTYIEAERRRLVALTRRMHEDWDEVGTSMRELRALVAANGGLPVGQGAPATRLRTMMWLAMLEVRDISLDGYAAALRCCPSTSAAKIDNDAFRTLAGDVEFRRNVSTESVVRVLNALLCSPDRMASDPPRYVQGMNTLVAPFLYVMGEGAGFYAFRQFLRKECPLYARPSLPGVHACVQLVDECLAHVDAPLYSHLRAHGAVAKIYAFPAAMTLSASVGPLRQVVRLWDYLLAYGVHLNVVCIVAQLLSMRELLVTTESPMKFLRNWPPLRADSVIRRTREIYAVLPDRLRRRIKLHAHEPQLAERLAMAPQVPDPIREPEAWRAQQRLPSPQSPRQASLKRDLPLSPEATSPGFGYVSTPASRTPSAGARPRARTFSGMAKRLRTVATSSHANQGKERSGFSSVARAAAPSYGSFGLGICSPTQHRHQQQQQQQQGGSHQPPDRVSSTNAATARRPFFQRGMRLIAGSEALWMRERKLSPRFSDS
ncbi:CDC16 protein [Coemansia sp. RSA 552]|nr:CDC16 protein [Coemansia sp. RSA 552]